MGRRGAGHYATRKRQGGKSWWTSLRGKISVDDLGQTFDDSGFALAKKIVKPLKSGLIHEQVKTVSGLFLLVEKMLETCLAKVGIAPGEMEGEDFIAMLCKKWCVQIPVATEIKQRAWPGDKQERPAGHQAVGF